MAIFWTFLSLFFIVSLLLFVVLEFVLINTGNKKVGKFLMKIACAVIALITTAFVFEGVVAQAYVYELDPEQQSNADRIASVAAAEWDNYGVLPSVAVAQAYIESQLGKARYNGYNMWGIGGADSSYYYGSVEEGTYGYLRTINNGYYGSAPFTTDPWSQIRKILDGGYCIPEGSYHSDVMWAIQTYDLEKYDQKMWADRRQERLEKFRQGVFTVMYDPELPSGVIEVDETVAKKGTICLYGEADKTLCGIFDVKVKKGGKKRYVRTSDLELLNKKVRLDIYEDAVG